MYTHLYRCNRSKRSSREHSMYAFNEKVLQAYLDHRWNEWLKTQPELGSRTLTSTANPHPSIRAHYPFSTPTAHYPSSTAIEDLFEEDRYPSQPSYWVIPLARDKREVALVNKFRRYRDALCRAVVNTPLTKKESDKIINTLKLM